MIYQIDELKEDYLDPAADLFLMNYEAEMKANPLLPVEIINEPERIKESLKSVIKNPGVALLHNNRLVGFMATGYTFKFKNQDTVMVPEFGHGALSENKRNMYRLMYKQLASNWKKNNLHIIGHLAHDLELKDTLFEIGFGAIITERLRDLSLLKDINTGTVNEEKDPYRLVDISIEHARYYPGSPIFINKNTDRDYVTNKLATLKSTGSAFFTYCKDDDIKGYIIVGESKKDGEGYLLQDTNTAQIKSIFIKPSFRGRGIGSCLLQKSIMWAIDNNYKRLFAEHESANYSGGNFWGKHFKPYLHFSMRYIDNVQ